jgi:hypothetical protein
LADATDRPSRDRTSPRPPGDRTHGADVLDAEFSDRFPYPMVRYTDAGGDVETQRDRLVSGHLMGKMDEQTGSGGLTRFQVPQGQALLQIDARVLQAGSILGRAKSFAVSSLRNYLVTDDAGKQYRICGQIAIADVGNDRVCEIQYYPEVIGSIGGVKRFRRIRERSLRQGSDYEMYFLFVIDSGRKVMNFSTTGTRGGQDISGLNLVAP